MIQMKVSIHYLRSPRGMRREQKKIVKEEMSALGAFWHREYLPLHFTAAAYTLYGAQQRSRAWNARKGHNLPMVGIRRGLERKATGRAEIRTTGRNTRVRMRNLRAINFSRANRARGIAYPDFDAELRAVAPAEPGRWARRIHDRTTERMNAVRTPETVSSH